MMMLGECAGAADMDRSFAEPKEATQLAEALEDCLSNLTNHVASNSNPPCVSAVASAFGHCGNSHQGDGEGAALWTACLVAVLQTALECEAPVHVSPRCMECGGYGQQL